MEFLNPYSIPALLALVLKIMLLWVVKVMPLRNAESKLFLAFLSVLALHNFSEVMVFNYSGPAEGLIPLRSGILYFSMSIVAMAILLHLMLVRLQSSTGWTLNVDQWKWGLYVPAGIVLAMLWMTDEMIRGFVPYEFSYTRVPGALYVWFETYSLVYLSAALAMLVVAALYSHNRTQRRKNVIALLGMTPIIVMPMLVIVLQKAGYPAFNLPMWFALALTFFLLVMTYAIYEHRVFDIFFHLPGTRLHSRRTRFHQSIKDFTAELDRLPSIGIREATNKLASSLKCSVVLIGSGDDALESQPLTSERVDIDIDGLRTSGRLAKIRDIVLTQELKTQDPETYSILSSANCAAVIPFRPFKETSAGWLLLGGTPGAPDRLPIDFAMVESLFEKMGDLFLEEIVRERVLLDQMRVELDTQTRSNEALRAELARKEQTIDTLYHEHAARHAGTGEVTSLDVLTANLEKRVIAGTLARLKGNVSATAKTLGLTRQTLYTRLEEYGIESDRWRRKRRGPEK